MNSQTRSRSRRALLLPRSPKASTIRLQRPAPSRLPQTKKSQRLSHPLPPPPSPPPTPQQVQPSFPLPHSIVPVNKGASEMEIENQYGQYSRKNYFRKNNHKGCSDLTDRIANKDSSFEKGERSKQKSKSALQYAKYFIKQVSNIPTDNSSREQQQPSLDENASPNLPSGTQRLHSNSRQIAREHSRQSHRASIMEKLKSLKSVRNRSRSIQKGSIKRSMLPSIEKASEKAIKSNLDDVKGSSSENMIDRIKIKKRNRDVVLKVRMINQSAPEVLDESMSLMVASYIDRSHSEKIETADKIDLYLQILNLLPCYVKQFREIYKEVECWDQLIFMTYKKFYLERLKVIQSLSNINPYYSPFRLPFSQVSAAQLRNFNPSLQGLRMEEKVQEQNKNIENALRYLYNHLIEKSGKFINMLQEDDFSQEIYFLMGEEVRLLGEEQQHVDSVRRNRMSLAIKCCYLIAYLNGQKVDIDLALTDGELTNSHLQKFELFLNSMV